MRESYDRKLPAFGHDVEKGKLAKAKAELAKTRAELTADLKDADGGHAEDPRRRARPVPDEQLPAVVPGHWAVSTRPPARGR